MAFGGIVFGALLLVAGIFLFLLGQGILTITLNLETLCAFGLILFGIIVLGGTLWGYRMARGRWRRWADDWEREP